MKHGVITWVPRTLTKKEWRENEKRKEDMIKEVNIMLEIQKLHPSQSGVVLPMDARLVPASQL
jgi:hypothetical protein